MAKKGVGAFIETETDGMIMIVVGLCMFGLFIGSFLNVIIHRVPKKQSIVRPRSACPACGTTLAPVDLIPVVSYVASGGSCRYCGEPITARYAVVEMMTAVLFALGYVHPDPFPNVIAWVFFGCFLLVMSAIDAEHMLLPNQLNAVGAVLALVFALVGWTGLSALDSIVGMAVGFGVVFVIVLLSKGGMGMGDGKFLAVIGGFLGYDGALMTLFVGSLIGAVVTLSFIALGRRKRDEPIPFGPYLAIGSLVVHIFPFKKALNGLFF